MCEVATYLKVGTTALVLKLIEDDFLPDLSLANPVASLHEVSRDITCTAQVRLADGRRLSAVQLQWEYLERAKKYVEREDRHPEQRRGPRAAGSPRWPRWRTTRSPCIASSTGSRSSACSRATASATASTGPTRSSAPIDLQYHDVRRDKGLYYRLEAAGKVERLTTDDEVDRAIMDPPEDTRAYFRGRCISMYPGRDRRGLLGFADLRHRGRTPCSASRCASRCGARATHVEDAAGALADPATLVGRLQG